VEIYKNKARKKRQKNVWRNKIRKDPFNSKVTSKKLKEGKEQKNPISDCNVQSKTFEEREGDSQKGDVGFLYS